MIAALIGGLMNSATAGATPAVPTSPNLTSYGSSLVRVNWTNGDATKQTRIYRKVAGVWSLLSTEAAAAVSYDTGLAVANQYVFGVSHYDPTLLTESAIVQASAVVPDDPTNVVLSFYQTSKMQLNWDTNAGSWSTRCYRNTGGAWSLITTVDSRTTEWSSGFTSGTLGVSHYDATSGLESNIVEGEQAA